LAEDWITIYSTSKFECPWCAKALDLLRVYGVNFFIKDVIIPKYLEEFKEQGYKTVPQCLVLTKDNEEVYIGGYENLEKYLRLNHSERARKEKQIENKVKF